MATAGLRVPGAAQDVEVLGEMYGTRPPAGYYERLSSDPGAFTFGRALAAPLSRSLAVRIRTFDVSPSGGASSHGSPVAGDFAFPLVLALFSDSPATPPFSREQVQAQFFDGPNPTGTVPELYSEMSGGLVRMTGVTYPWVRTGLTKNEVAGGSSGLGLSSRVGPFIREAVAQLDSTGLDWGAFDNDGPDGLPNSGDDDGFVDVLTVMHPTPGGECPSLDRPNRIWSHRWRLSALLGQPFFTTTVSANGGLIRIDDYTIQPSFSCDEVSINEIGVFAHELGHGFGLPDLYAVGREHAGVGQWDLMGTGSWGCPGGFRPARPCGMGAWTRWVLGWADVVDLARDLDHGTLGLSPVEESGAVIRIPSGDTSGEFFLLENRQRLGPDGDIPAEGLLVWHVDPELVEERWLPNTVNSDPGHMGVWLRQADGLNELAAENGGRGDGGDVFVAGQGLEFHAGSVPSAVGHGGEAAGVTVLDIDGIGDDLELRVVTRYQALTVATEGTTGAEALITVDGVALPPGTQTLASAPFQHHVIEAAPGEPLGPDRRNGFLGWEDDSDRVRQFMTGLVDSTLTASYSGVQVRVNITLQGPVAGVAPGTIQVTPGTPDGWGPEGETVEIHAISATGFGFEGWGGSLAGDPNPTTRTLDGPVHAEARFGQTFAVAAPPSGTSVPAAQPVEIAFSVENANLPVTWAVESGALPEAVRLTEDGVLLGAAFEVGEFPLEIRATDAVGLTEAFSFHLEVTEPEVELGTLLGPFLGLGAVPQATLQQFLDRRGNENGQYDLGDFRAYVLAHPELPVSGIFEGVPPDGPAPSSSEVPPESPRRSVSPETPRTEGES